MESNKDTDGKQYKLWPDSTERGVWSESTLFSLNVGIWNDWNNNKKKPQKRDTKLERTYPKSEAKQSIGHYCVKSMTK